MLYRNVLKEEARQMGKTELHFNVRWEPYTYLTNAQLQRQKEMYNKPRRKS